LSLAVTLVVLAAFASYLSSLAAPDEVLLASPLTPAQLLPIVTGLGALLVSLAALARVRRERSLRRRAEVRLSRLAQGADRTQELVTIVNRKGQIEYVNQAVERVTGYAGQDLVGRRSRPCLPWYPDEETFGAARAAALAQGGFSAVVDCRRKDGSTFPLQESLYPLQDPSLPAGLLVSTARDISLQRQVEDRVAFLTRFDPLTGVPNRGHFAELLRAELQRPAPGEGQLVVVALDIDRFNELNALFWPERGDGLLRRTAEVLRTLAGPRGIVGRLGGDEFAIATRLASPLIGARRLAQSLRSTLAQVVIDGQQIAVTVAIGVAIAPENGPDAPSLFRSAETALSSAKGLGRNAVQFFSRRLSQEALERYSVEKRLLNALQNAEYELHYQPYCELATGRVTGAEALIRWHSPDLGLLSPSKFVPTLEDSGLMIAVGEWVLRKACWQLKSWEKQHPLSVAVNLSQLQFSDPNLVSLVSEVIREHEVDPSRLTLELTETICANDLSLAGELLRELKGVGVSISIDDFGTGYSSLSYVKRLPLDCIKMDMSFVKDVTTDPDAASIVSAITGMARGLGLKTIAEGVESEEQRNVLRLLRCDMGQGYLFSPPVEANAFEQYIAR
jgi:diguanylate cyclase (GGDEF)-like protein/PAS domain S-box-containing protein